MKSHNEKEAENKVEQQISLYDQLEQNFKYFLTEKCCETVLSLNIREAVTIIKAGNWLTKRKRRFFVSSRATSVFVRVDMEFLSIIWSRQKISVVKTKSLKLAHVLKIVPGFSKLPSEKKISSNDKEFGISIISRKRVDTFIFQVFSDWTMWLKGLCYAHYKSRVKSHDSSLNSIENTLLRYLWDKSDLNATDTMQFNEYASLLNNLKYEADPYYMKYVFYQSIEDASYLLEYSEFVSMILSILTSECLKEDFFKYCNGGVSKPLMTDDEFTLFLQTSQKMLPHQTQKEISTIQSYTLPFYTGTTNLFMKSLQNRLTFMGFYRYITSPENNAFCTSRMNCYQSMKKPIQNYWIRTLYRWLKKNDTPTTALARLSYALRHGYRAVIIPCIVNKNSVICPTGSRTNGTTNAILFKDVLETLVNNSSMETNNLPIFLIFLLRNEQDANSVASLIMSVMRNRLVGLRCSYDSVSSEKSVFDSPDSLRGFFIPIKIVSNEQHSFSSIKTSSFNAFYRDWEYLINLDSEAIFDQQEPPIKSSSEDDTKENFSSTHIWTSCHHLLNTSINDVSQNYKNNFYLSNDELKMIFLNNQSTQALHDIVSKNSAFGLVFPEGNTLACFCPDPVLSWSFGIQMVASPYKSPGIASLILESRFRENGNCGYVAKPAYSKEKPLTSLFLEHPVRFSVSILAGKQLPRTVVDEKLTPNVKDLLSPYVVVSISGHPLDKAAQKTPLVFGNSFNPVWPPTNFTFTVTHPSIAFLIFRVHHLASFQSISIGYAAIPIPCLQSGLRWVPLKDSRFSSTLASGLIVRISFHETAQN